MIGNKGIDNRLRTLRSLPELAPFTDSQLRSLLPYFDELTVPAGRRLAKLGQFCTEYLVLIEGGVEARDEARARLLRPGESTGWSAMWDRSRNPETLIATTGARLLVMGRAQFRAIAALAGSSSHRGRAGDRADARPLLAVTPRV
jgi:CRP-like cAMP-binding protein